MVYIPLRRKFDGCARLLFFWKQRNEGSDGIEPRIIILISVHGWYKIGRIGIMSLFWCKELNDNMVEISFGQELKVLKMKMNFWWKWFCNEPMDIFGWHKFSEIAGM